MKNSPLWVKLALAFALTSVIGVLVAALLVQRSTASSFDLYLQHVSGMGGMMGGGASGMMGAPETEFLASVRQSLWIAGGIAVVLAALLAFVLSRQITAPLRRLSVAASGVAAGDTSCRVEVGTSDEVGKLSQSFNCMVESLERNQEARRTLMSDLAHEMSTPLTVMQGNMEGMLDGMVGIDRAGIASLHEETMLLSRLVQDLRTLSQAESGRLNIAVAPDDLAQLLGTVVSGMAAEARRRKVSLEVRADPAIPKVRMDHDRISQVLVNLLSNALRYTPDGGTIEIRATAGAGSQPGEVVVSVSDTGQGIAQDDLPHIFDRYYRGKQPRDKRSGGSGIGLAVVKELVDAHKGRVWVESREGVGSTFSFTLPVA